MRNDRLIPGTILVIIGILFLLNNFGAIEFNWWVFFNLWPILLIIGGVNLVFANNRSQWATILKILVLIGGMAILIICGLTSRRPSGWPSWTYHLNRDLNDDDDRDTADVADTTGGRSIVKVDGNSIYREAYKPGLQLAKLNISGGATTYTLKGVTNDLFEATTKEYNIHYRLKTRTDSTTAVIDFDMNTHKHGFGFNFGSKKNNRADIKLNSNPEWDISLQSGASKADFDLSYFKVKNLTIEGGAASYNIKLGQPLALTTISISTGAASATLYVPKNAACHITTDTGLSSKKFDGFDKKDDDTYETPGYDKATNKMKINMEGGVSNFKVIRY
jgi:hypothetical protein